MVKAEHHFVQMKSERVRMVQTSGNWVVTADFVFVNHGPRTTVTMGFPEGSYSEATSNENWSRHSSFGSFASWVDGQQAKVRRVVNLKKGSNDFNALWIKQVTFGAHQTRRVRVRYLSGGGGDSSGGQFVTYDFTGGNWKGVVEKSVLSLEFTQPDDYYVHKPYASSTQAPNIERHRNQLTYTWSNWQAQEDFDVYYERAIPGALQSVSLKELRLPTERNIEFIAISPRKSNTGSPIYSYRYTAAFWRNGELWASCNWLARGTILKGKEYPMRWNERKRQIEILRPQQRPIIVSARGAVYHLPARSDRAMWLGHGGSSELFVRAVPLAHQLGIRLVVNHAQRRVSAVPF